MFFYIILNHSVEFNRFSSKEHIITYRLCILNFFCYTITELDTVATMYSNFNYILKCSLRYPGIYLIIYVSLRDLFL